MKAKQGRLELGGGDRQKKMLDVSGREIKGGSESHGKRRSRVAGAGRRLERDGEKM